MDHITGDNIFSELFFYTGFLLQNRCPTRYEKKVEDGFDFPSDKSSVSFWIVRVGWVNLMLQSICDDCWAHAWLAFQPVQFDLLESTSFCTLACVSSIIILDNQKMLLKNIQKMSLFFFKKSWVCIYTERGHFLKGIKIESTFTGWVPRG